MQRDVWLVRAMVLTLAACGGAAGLSESTPSDLCDGRAVVDPVLPETLEGNHYLAAEVGTYTVKTSLYLAEGTLCIEPGVRVEIAKGGRVVVGSDREAALVAVGKLADGTVAPITFTSAAELPHLGDWDKLYFTPRNRADVSVLDTVVVEYAGAFNQHGKANVVVEGTSVALRDVSIRKGLGMGLYFETADAFPSAFERVHFETLGDAALALDLRHLARLAGGASVGAEVSHALLRGGNLYESATLPAWGVPWALEGESVGLQNGAVLTIEPGVELRLGDGLRLTAGGQTPGGFEFAGTPEAPIVLQSNQREPGPGDWDKLVVTPKTSRAVFRHVTLRHAGQLETSGGKTALVIGGPVDEFVDVRVEESAGYGILVQAGAPLPAVLERVEVVSSTLPALSLGAEHLPLLAADVTLPAGGVVALRGGALASGVDLSGVAWPVQVEAPVALTDGASLTLGAGAVWSFAPGAGLFVGADGGTTTLVSEGSAEAPVRFTSSAVTPAAGDWDKLLLGPGCQGAGCRLQHVAVEFGGGGDVPARANVAIVGSDPALDDVALSDSAGWGLWLSSDATPAVGAITYARNASGNQGAE
jgi:hypothetical protein